MKKIVSSCILASSLLFGSNSLDLNLNNNTLEISGDIYLNNMYSFSNNSNYYLNLTYLKTEDNDNSITDELNSFGLKVLNPYSDNFGLSFGVGIKAVSVSNGNKDFSATPISLFAKYEISEAIYVDGGISYAPVVLTYMDGESYTDMDVKISYRILEEGYIYTGIRKIETNYTNNLKKEFDDNLFFGYKVRF